MDRRDHNPRYPAAGGPARDNKAGGKQAELAYPQATVVPGRFNGFVPTEGEPKATSAQKSSALLATTAAVAPYNPDNAIKFETLAASDQVGLRIPAFCKRYGIGRTTAYQLIKDGVISRYKVGRRTLIHAEDAYPSGEGRGLSAWLCWVVSVI